MIEIEVVETKTLTVKMDEDTARILVGLLASPMPDSFPVEDWMILELLWEKFDEALL